MKVMERAQVTESLMVSSSSANAPEAQGPEVSGVGRDHGARALQACSQTEQTLHAGDHQVGSAHVIDFDGQVIGAGANSVDLDGAPRGTAPMDRHEAANP